MTFRLAPQDLQNFNSLGDSVPHCGQNIEVLIWMTGSGTTDEGQLNYAAIIAEVQEKSRDRNRGFNRLEALKRR